MTDILQWKYGEDGYVNLSYAHSQENVVHDNDIIVPLGALSTALIGISDIIGDARVLSIKDEFEILDLDSLVKIYPNARFMWVSEIKLVSDLEETKYKVGFHNLEIEANMLLPASWTGKKQGCRALISVKIFNGRNGEKTIVNDIPVEYLLWYGGYGRFEHYISSDRDTEKSLSWYPEFISMIMDFLDIAEEVDKWSERYIEMEKLYHYIDFKRAFCAKNGTAAEVVLEICRTFNIRNADLLKALDMST